MGFWGKFADIAKIVGPIVLSTIPGVPPLIVPLVVHGIAEAEALPGANGAEKKAHVLEMVSTGINGLNAVKQEVVVDPMVITGAVSQGVDAIVTTIRAIQAAHVEDAAEAATVTPKTS